MDIETTGDLHNIRARLQYYAALLVDFTKSVKFVQETPNPALGVPTKCNVDDIENSTKLEERKTLSEVLMNRECKILLSEINRLERTRHLMELRLKNVMTLVMSFLSVVALSI